MKNKKHKVAIMVFDQVEVLDFAGPFEVFSVCGSIRETSFFEVWTVAERHKVSARNGLELRASYTFEECPEMDILLVPGGGGYKSDGRPYGSRKEMDNPVFLDFIQKHASSLDLLLTVCTGSLILARTGLLDGLKATSHFGALEDLKQMAPKVQVEKNVRWTDNGKIITSAGVSAGIDMALYVIQKLHGQKIANETAAYMQYDYWKSV